MGSMDSEECDEVFKKLLYLLDQNRLYWIVEQVNEQVHLGKTVEKEIETLKEEKKEFSKISELDIHKRQMKKGPKARFPVTEEYNPNEKLNLLLDAIEQAIVNSAEMEYHLIEYFGSSLAKWDGINFYQDEPESQPISLNIKTISDRLDNSLHLKDLINNKTVFLYQLVIPVYLTRVSVRG